MGENASEVIDPPELELTIKADQEKGAEIVAKVSARDAAIKTLQDEEKRRVDECMKEIGAALKKYKCGLVGVPSITEDGRIVAAAAVVSR